MEINAGQFSRIRPEMAFRVLIIGGTGQVGAAVVRALAAEPSCAEVVMVNRRAIAVTADPRVRQVILDTAAAQRASPADQALTLPSSFLLCRLQSLEISGSVSHQKRLTK